MKATSLCLIAAVFSATACAQVMMEHAAAVAGATVGTIGGKVLSNGIDKVLGKAAETGSTAAKKAEDAKPLEKKTDKKAGEEAAPKAKMAIPSSGALFGTPTGTGHSTRAARASADKPVFAIEERSIPAPVAAIAPPPPTAEEIAKIKEGASVDAVFASLGTPSSHITIPDDGHLVEILTYSNGDERIGTIRADNGQVVSVTPVSPK